MRIAIAVLLALTAIAAANPGTFVEGPPPELQTFDPTTADARVRILDRLIAETTEPLERAGLVLARADLAAARAVHARGLAVRAELAAGETRDPAARARHSGTAKRQRAAAAAATRRAIADYTTVFCAPGARDLACAAPPALRAWARADDAAMGLAYLLASSSRADDAARVYRRVVADHPTSRHAADAHLGLADHAFEAADMATARVHYRAVVKSHARANVRAYAAYKQGWVELDLGLGREAFATFRAVLAIDPRGRTAVAARKDLVRAYALFGTAADAFATLETIAPGTALDAASELATMWSDQGKAADALALDGELVRRAPDDARVCAWQGDAAAAARVVGDRVRWLAEIERLVAIHARLRGGDAACAQVTRTFTLVLARELASEVAATRDRETAVMVDRLFELFARALPDDPDAAAARRERAATRQRVRP